MSKKKCGCGKKKKPNKKGQKKMNGGFVAMPDKPGVKPMLGVKKGTFGPKIYW